MTIEVSLAAVTLGPYVLGRRIGVGGMGEVFVAMRSDGGEPVALKLLLHHLSEQRPAVEMFLNEARLLARMAHPNVVRILDVGAGDGRYYLAMELVSGVPLIALIDALARSGVTIGAGLVLHIARGLLQGLHHAHRQRVVHRDVSPHNVLVSVDGEVKVTDFGIALAPASPHFTRPGHVRGKCEYVAPEQVRAHSADARADLFSAAVTLAHLATGRSIFFRGGIADTMRAVVLDPFPELRELDPRLAAALTRAASKEPGQRFQSARELLDALPPAPPGSARELGLLVRRLCEIDLEATLGATRELETASGLKATLLPDTDLSPVMPRRSPIVVRAAAAATVLLVALGAVAVAGSSPAPRPADGRTEPPVEARRDVPHLARAPRAEPLEELPPLPRPAAEPPRPKPRPKAPEPAIGFLTVDAVPWAEVFIDGRLLGETPLAEQPLPAGRQRVVLKNPHTGAEVSRTITIRKGQESIVKEDLR